MNEPKFDPVVYESYRPLYPHETFRPLNNTLRYLIQPLSVLDLGCGTGAAIESLLRSISPAQFSKIEVTAVDPDSGMLETAQRRFSSSPEFYDLRITWKTGSAEQIPAADSSIDLLLVGSAFHWFHPEKSISEITRVCRPGSEALLFEYQFPKSTRNPALNDWARKNFNQFWKAPSQTPRGSLKELSKSWRENPEWKFMGSAKPSMICELDRDAFLGHLVSQSRYLHYEAELGPSERLFYREGLKQSLTELYGEDQTLSFDFYLSAFHFVKNQ